MRERSLFLLFLTKGNVRAKLDLCNKSFILIYELLVLLRFNYFLRIEKEIPVSSGKRENLIATLGKRVFNISICNMIVL